MECHRCSIERLNAEEGKSHRNCDSLLSGGKVYAMIIAIRYTLRFAAMRAIPILAETLTSCIVSPR